MAFAVLQKREYADLEHKWERNNGRSWIEERRYIDTLTAFDEVNNLGIFSNYDNPPSNRDEFFDFFDEFSRQAEKVSKKFKMEAARRLKTGTQNIIVLDESARKAIHALINAIREKLNELTLSENKRDSLFNKLNAFAAEVDLNRTRTEAFLSFAVDVARTAREVKEEVQPLQQTIDRVLDLIDKATKWTESLPPWKDRKQIEGPPKRLAPPPQDLDDDIPF